VPFRLLGPVEVVHDGCPLDLGGPKPRSVLAVLLLAPGRVVEVGDVVAAVWGADPPGTARKAVQVYVSNLRRALAPVPGITISGRRGGYVAEVDPDRVDLHRFRRLAAAAADAGTDSAQRREFAAQAVGLWLGAPLSGLGDAPLPERERAGLDEEHLSAREQLIALDIDAGQPGAVVPDLLAIVGEHPLRETAHVLLMRALRACGRLTEALAVFRDARRFTVDELGSEPGPELVALHQELLAQEHRGVERTPPATPAQLPADIRDFAGRCTELADLTQLLAARDEGTAVVALTGFGGVGKTTLALRVAHRARADFDGGQLFADLRGASASPAAPEDVLADFLGAFGVEHPPPGRDARAALYRSVTADRRVLVVLDDAADAAQVDPLIPGGPRCAVLVTARSRLGGLHRARRHALRELDRAAAVRLLARTGGQGRVEADPQAAARIVAACGDVPLAVRVAGARLAARPSWTLPDYADRLDERVRSARLLDELRDGSVTVRASFALTYDQLDAAGARAFRLLALPDAPVLALPTAAAVLGLDPADAEEVVSDLVDLHLVDEPAPATFAFHDMSRFYARERAADEEPDDVRHEAVLAAFAHVGVTAAAALDTMMPGLGLADIGLPGPVAPVAFADAGAAVRWLDREHVTVTGLGTQVLGLPAPPLAAVGRLARILGNYAELAGVWPGWRTLSERLLERARHLGDEDAEHSARIVLAGLALRRGDPEATGRLLAPAVERARRLGDHAGLGRLLAMHGVAYRAAGLAVTAEERFREALAAHRRSGNRRSVASTLVHLADALGDRGHHVEAVTCAREVEAIEAELPAHDPYLRMSAQEALGDARAGLGQHSAAVDAYGRAVRLAAEYGNPVTRTSALIGLARVHLAAGRPAEAASRFEEALEVLPDNDPDRRQRVTDELTAVLRQLGRPDQAAARAHPAVTA
jgi:DNA-binding SARP family transcriptional activator